VCRHVWLRTENNQTPFTKACQEGQVLRIPIAHNEGNFFISDQELAELQENRQIVFRYSDAQGKVTPEANPNGSIDSIAGVMNRQGNVMGMMPHPERASEALLGSEDGRFIFKSMIDRIHSVSR
jgi:phosphoribosylformylglycinamidine synthase